MERPRHHPQRYHPRADPITTTYTNNNDDARNKNNNDITSLVEDVSFQKNQDDANSNNADAGFSTIAPTKNQDDASLDDNGLAAGAADERCLAEDISF